jgi:4-hydroxybenzoate polyprenyltransferase
LKTFYYIITSMRPRQWTKNLILFAGLIFSQNLANTALVWKSVEAFLIFCVLSGVVYLVNDVADVEKDRLHATKRNRPIPSGRLKPSDAIAAAVVMAAAGLALAALVGWSFFAVAVIFFLLNFFYSLVLKRVVLVDVMSISLSFVLRAIAGVEALVGVDPTIEISPWLLICTLFLSLLLAFCKRRHELTTLGEATRHREALAEYSPALIDQLVGISAGGAVLSYSIYTIWPDTVDKFGTTALVYTIPLVLVGVMRYLYLVYNKEKGGNPTEMLLTEKFLLIDVFLWILLVVAIFHVF